MADTHEHVECRICGRKLYLINDRHLSTHNTTTEEYSKEFPNTPLYSIATSELLSKATTRQWSDPLTATRTHDAIRASGPRRGANLWETWNKPDRGPMGFEGHTHPPEWCQQHSTLMKALRAEDPKRFNTVRREEGHEVSEKTRQLIAESRKAWWNSLTPEEQSARISYNLSQCKKGRTFPEELLDNLLQQEHPNEWRFVGDGTHSLGHRNPDFINHTLRGVIEVFGLYWHDPELFPNRPTESELIEHYLQHNYKCLVLWEHEVYDEETSVTKIKEAFYNVNRKDPN